MLMSSSNRAALNAPGLMPPTCPWCNGRLSLKASNVIEELVPGGMSMPTCPEIPAQYRQLAAWICDTPHCRYRRPVTAPRNASRS
jgi:hypothetical protein